MYGRVKPLLEVGKEQEQVEAMLTQVNDKKENLLKEQQTCKLIEQEINKITEDTENLKKQLESTSSLTQESKERLSAISAAKVSIKL